MAGLENETQDMVAEEMDTEFTETVLLEDDEVDEVDEYADIDKLEDNFKFDQKFAFDSVETNVEEILKEIATEANMGDNSNIRVRKRLEAMIELKRVQEELVDFEEYDIHD
jgi:hypothetical protein